MEIKPLFSVTRTTTTLSKEDKGKLIQGMLESNDVKTLYNDYIRKEIPFEKWVIDMVGYMVDSDNTP